jgi:uncharacterized protein involved in exopolysaccharide biosynthesis
MEQNAIMQKKPLDYLKMIFRRKWLIIVPTVIGLAAGILMANILPKAYRASTLILVEEGRIINPLIEGLAVSTSVAERLIVLREQILGWDRINQLISKLGLAKDVKSQKDFENLVLRLRKNIRVQLRGRNIINISYEGGDRVEARDIVKTITDIFIAENLKQQTSETENAISFINDQLALYQKKLKQAEISGMEEKLNDLLIDSTEKHPVVIELRGKIRAAKTEVESGDYQAGASAITGSDGDIETLREELKNLREELAASSLDSARGGANRAKLATAANEKLYSMLLLDRIEKVTVEDTGVNQKLYNELLQRLETAKITQRLEASIEGTRYTVLDPARLPLKPVKPNKLYVLLAGMLVGVCAGFSLGSAAEIFDRSLLSVDEAKTHLELPMLGAISKIITEADVRAEKIRRIKITGASILTGTALLVIIIFNVFLGS